MDASRYQNVVLPHPKEDKPLEKRVDTVDISFEDQDIMITDFINYIQLMSKKLNAIKPMLSEQNEKSGQMSAQVLGILNWNQ